jgi:quinol monooxygenase YgiN
MVLTVIANIKARNDAADKVRARLSKLVEPTRREKGCVEYTLYQDNDNPSVFIFYENWESQTDLDAHMKSPHFKECFAAIEGLFDIEVHLMSEVVLNARR